MIIQVGQQMQQPAAHAAAFAKVVVRERFVQPAVGHRGEGLFHGLSRRGELGQYARAWYISIGKFPLAVAHIARSAQFGADKMLKIAGKMLCKRTGAIGNLTAYLPEAFLIRKSVDLRDNLVEIAQEIVLKFCYPHIS